jgi:hypothetical protein
VHRARPARTHRTHPTSKPAAALHTGSPDRMASRRMELAWCGDDLAFAATQTTTCRCDLCAEGMPPLRVHELLRAVFACRTKRSCYAIVDVGNPHEAAVDLFAPASVMRWRNVPGGASAYVRGTACVVLTDGSLVKRSIQRD